MNDAMNVARQFCPDEAGARHLNSETGDPIWYCPNWNVWWCGPKSSLPTWPTPGAIRFDWIEQGNLEPMPV